MNRINIPFEPLPPELAMELECPDFRDKTFFDRLFDIFKEKEVDYSEAGKRRRIIRSRIFRR